MTNTVLNMRTDIEHPETGIDDTKLIAMNVSACLADSYILMVKTQAYHWNAVGPLFHSVHELTEKQYENLFSAIDVLAERVRALGYPAPSSITDMISLSAIDADMGNPTTEEMMQNLVADHETVARRFRESAERAEDGKDPVTADMLTERLAFHEKSSWMLRALLTG